MNHAEAVAWILARPPLPCRLCGAQLHQITDEHADEFTWADEKDSLTGTDPDLVHLYDPAANSLGATDPYDALSKMAALMGHAQAAKRACLTPLFWRMAREYSALMVRLDSGLTFHVHRPELRGPLAGVEQVDQPWHCGWPALLRPSGWYCRPCGKPLTCLNA